MLGSTFAARLQKRMSTSVKWVDIYTYRGHTGDLKEGLSFPAAVRAVSTT